MNSINPRAEFIGTFKNSSRILLGYYIQLIQLIQMTQMTQMTQVSPGAEFIETFKNSSRKSREY